MIVLPPVVGQTVAAVSGRNVPVVCDNKNPAEWGEYSFLLDRVRLRPSACAAIVRFIDGIDDPLSDASVVLLAHEAWHASRAFGWRDETLTECRAYRDVATVGVLLGASLERAGLLPAESAWYHDWVRRDPVYGRSSCETVSHG